MDYTFYAKELLEYLVDSERKGHIIQGNISRITKGEDALIQYLMLEGDGICANQISNHFGVNTSRVAAILNSLTKKGYVERQVDLSDKRKIRVYITEKGKIYGDNTRKEVLSKVVKILELLGENDAREYIRIQKRIIDIIQEEIKL